MNNREINSSAIQNPLYELPDGWKWVRLGEVCEVNPPRPKNFTRNPDAPTTFIPMSAVDEKKGTINNSQIVLYSKVAKGYTYFEENDVLFAKITPCMQNGKHIIAKNLIDGIGFGTTEFHVLRCKNIVIPEWIHYFIRQSFFLQEATAYFTGAVGQQRVPEYFLAEYIIPLPPIKDQRSIVSKIKELMQDIERARNACERQLEAINALPSAYLREVFESEEAKRWERKRLGEVCEIIKGKKPKVYDVRPDFGGLPYLTTEVIRYSKEPQWCLESDKNSVKVNEDEIIIITDGSNSGEIFTGYKGVLASTMGKLKIDDIKIINDYIYFFIKMNFNNLNEPKRGSAIPHLEKEIFFNLYIPLPPLKIQRRIALKIKELMQDIERARNACEKQLEAINALPQAILKKAFRGEL